MTARSTVVLVVLAVVALALGLVYGLPGREPEAGLPVAQPAFPGLAGKLGDAAAIEIAAAGKTLKLARAGDAWTLPDKGGYPALVPHVHELLAGLDELKLAEPRTANADDYARLGVADLPKQAAKDGAEGATLVRVLDAGGGAIAQLLLGHERAGSGGNGDGIYVRKPGEAQAWLAEGHLSASADPADWLDKDIASVPADRVTAVAVTRGEQTLSFARADGKMALQAPAEHPNLDQFKLDDVGRALDALQLEDVQRAPAPGAPEGKAVFTTADGMTVTVDVSKDKADIWATFAAAGDGKAKAAATALADKVKGWAYKLGNWKETALVPTLDDLKAEAPPPAAPAGPRASAPATAPPP